MAVGFAISSHRDHQSFVFPVQACLSLCIFGLFWRLCHCCLKSKTTFFFIFLNQGVFLMFYKNCIFVYFISYNIETFAFWSLFRTLTEICFRYHLEHKICFKIIVIWCLLHWLPIQHCSVFKTALLVYKFLQCGYPNYFEPFLKPGQSVYNSCWSQADCILLEVPYFASSVY